MELVDALLDVLDAVIGAFGLAAFWVNWVRPRRGRKRPSPDGAGQTADVDRFLHEASKRKGSGGVRA